MSQIRGMNVQDAKETGTVGGTDTMRVTNSLSGCVYIVIHTSATKEINWYKFLPFDFSSISLCFTIKKK
jgi:hypothetical protein